MDRKKCVLQALESFQMLIVYPCTKDQRSKLDNKFKPCIFLGYSKDEFGYRLWDLFDKNVVRSRDIVFMEDKTIEDRRQQKLVSSSQLAIVMESAEADPSPTRPTYRQLLTDATELEATRMQQ